jgi:hypothetical protein
MEGRAMSSQGNTSPGTVTRRYTNRASIWYICHIFFVKLNIKYVFSQMQLIMEGELLTSQNNNSPGLVTRSQFSQNMEGGAAMSEHMRTPTRPRNSPAKRAV